MIQTLIVTIATGWLAFNATLYDVGVVRQTQNTAWPIDSSIDLGDYECLLGVPYGYGHLIGTELYFHEEGGAIHGPFLATDVESVRHHPRMKDNYIVADVNCPELVHAKGYISIEGEDEPLLTVSTRFRMPMPTRHNSGIRVFVRPIQLPVGQP